MCEIVGAIRNQYLAERIRYSIEWMDRLKPEVNSYPATARDRMSSSAWAVDAASPATGVVVTGSGYDVDLGVAWVSIESDGSLVDGDVVYLNNTIETTGIRPCADMDNQTSDQRMQRQIRIRFKDC